MSKRTNYLAFNPMRSFAPSRMRRRKPGTKTWRQWRRSDAASASLYSES